MSAHDNCLPAALFYPTGSLPPPPPLPPLFHFSEGKSPSTRSPLARPNARPPTPVTLRGGKNIIPDFEDPSRCHRHRHTSRPRYGGRPPTPVQRWRRRSPLKGALGEGGGGGGGCGGGGVERSRARLTGTRGGGGGSAAGRRAGGTPPHLDWLGVRARSIRETIPLIAAVSPSSLAHTRPPTVITVLYTFFRIFVFYFSSLFSLRPTDRLTISLLLFYTHDYITDMLYARRLRGRRWKRYTFVFDVLPPSKLYTARCSGPTPV